MEKEIIEVSLEDIIPNRFQPRLSFDEDELNGLAKSIRQHGIIQPLVLRKVGNKYEIIAGERRYKASFIAGLTKVPAVVIDLNDNESAEVAIVENIQRKNLSALEEAKSYKKLLDRGYLTQEELAARMGKTQGAISNKLRLLNLTNEVQDALLNNEISERHARSLLRIDNPEDQVEVLRTIIRERLNVRDTDRLIDSLKQTEELEPVRSYGKTLGGSRKETIIDFETLFNEMNEIQTEKAPSIEDKQYPEIEDKKYPEIDYEETLLLDDEKDDEKKEKLQEKVKNFIEELKREGYISTYDSYEFDSLYEFIIKINK
jgi:ParB family chromosome partitioning protein